jgi:hypothetical protein
MAFYEYLPELGAETLEIEGRAAKGQAGPVSTLQAVGQIRGGDWHAPSIRRLEPAEPRLISFTSGHQSI